MAILFSVTIFAFCALLWAAFSVARHLRRSPPAPQHGPDRDQAERDYVFRRSNEILRSSY